MPNKSLAKEVRGLGKDAGWLDIRVLYLNAGPGGLMLQLEVRA